MRRWQRRGSDRAIITILWITGLLYTVLHTLLLPAIPTLEHKLHSSPNATTWILTAYVLSGAVATPVAGRLADMYGKRPALMCVLAVMAVGLLVCGLSTTLVPMIGGRLLCGVSSGAFPIAYGIIRDEFDTRRVAGAIGVMSVSVGAGTGLGAVLSGVILEGFSYHWLYWFPLVVLLPTLLAAWLWIPESPVRPGGRVDWVGAALVALGLLGVLIGITEASSWGWGSPKTLGLIFGGLLVLLLWVRFELGIKAPLIDMHTMAIPGVWRTNLAAGLFGFGSFAAFALIPQFVEQPHATGYGFAASVIAAGVFLLPATLTMVLFAPMMGPIERALGARVPLIIGGAFGGGGMVLIAASDAVQWHVYVGMFLVGIGVGLAFGAMPNLIVKVVPLSQTGAATAINTIMRVLGGAIGIQICATVIAEHLAHSGLPLDHGFAISFWICAAAMAAAGVVALTVPRGSPQREPEVTPQAAASPSGIAA